MNYNIPFSLIFLGLFVVVNAVAQNEPLGKDISLLQKFSFSTDGVQFLTCCNTAGFLRANYSYQHHDFLGFGVGFASANMFQDHSYLLGYTLHYRMMPGRFSVQADAGLITHWNIYASHSFKSTYTGKGEPFFMVSAAWMPVPVFEIGLAGIAAPRISYTQTIIRDPLPDAFKDEVRTFFVVYPYIGLRFPGRWDRFKKGYKSRHLPPLIAAKGSKPAAGFTTSREEP